MTTFNFTVRAVDERGAYADRDFSIKVRNSIVDRYIAMSVNGQLYTSPDGVAWTQRINEGVTNTDVFYSNNIVYGNGQWFAPLDATQYMLSIDGVNWTKYNWPTNGTAVAGAITSTLQTPRVVFQNGKFYIAKFHRISSNTTVWKQVFTSIDGIEWEGKESVSTAQIQTHGSFSYQNIQAPISGGGKLIMTNGTSSDRINISTDDGLTWQSANTKVQNMHNVYYFNGLYFCISHATMDLTTSLDGFNWTIQPMPKYAHVGFSNLLYGNGRLVAVPHRSVNTSAGTPIDFVMTSLDGIIWEKVQLPWTVITTSQTFNRATATYHNGLFFIFYNNAPVSMTAGVIGFVSQDAKTWEPVLAADFPNMTTGIHTFGGIGQD